MIASVVLDPITFVVLEADEGMCQLLGVTPSRLVGRSFWQWIQEPAHKDLGNALSVSMRNGQLREFRVVVQTALQTRVCVQIQAVPFPRSVERPVLRLNVLVAAPASGSSAADERRQNGGSF